MSQVVCELLTTQKSGPRSKSNLTNYEILLYLEDMHWLDIYVGRFGGMQYTSVLIHLCNQNDLVKEL